MLAPSSNKDPRNCSSIVHHPSVTLVSLQLGDHEVGSTCTGILGPTQGLSDSNVALQLHLRAGSCWQLRNQLNFEDTAVP